MAEIKQRLTRANRVAHLESLINHIRGDDNVTIPKADREWLIDLLSPIASTHTQFRVVPERHRPRPQNVLFDALAVEFRNLSNDDAEQRLQDINQLFHFILTRGDEALDHETRHTLVSLAKMLRHQLLQCDATPKRPSSWR